jgi:hypothetical protein
MTNQTTSDNATALTEQIIKQVINAWASQNKNVTTFFTKYDDSVYMHEVAPGRNRAIYLFGHLIATNDGLLPILGLGEKLYPELYEIFSHSPDKAVPVIPSLPELKQKWETINTLLTGYFSKMTINDWLGRHMSVSEEDFAKEPLRNKLNVLIGRTNHESYHIGQLNLLSH